MRAKVNRLRYLHILAIKCWGLIKRKLLETSIFIGISFWKIFMLELKFVDCARSRILSIDSQVNRQDTTLIGLYSRNVLKMHWSTNSNDTAQLCAIGGPQLQPSLLAVTYGSCQAALSDKFDLLQLNEGIKKKAKVSLKLTRLKAKFILKLIFFFLHTVTPLYINFVKFSALVTSTSLLYLDFFHE